MNLTPLPNARITSLFRTFHRSPAAPRVYAALAVLLGAVIAHYLPEPWAGLFYRVITAAVEAFV